MDARWIWRTDATLLQRGARSGVGIGLFETGGIVVDGGRTPSGGAPPILARLDFPPDWRIVLVLAPKRQGLQGENELAAFRSLAPMATETVGEIVPADVDGGAAFDRGARHRGIWARDHAYPAIARRLIRAGARRTALRRSRCRDGSGSPRRGRGPRPRPEFLGPHWFRVRRGRHRRRAARGCGAKMPRRARAGHPRRFPRSITARRLPT